jgi:hypothetical protein
MIPFLFVIASRGSAKVTRGYRKLRPTKNILDHQAHFGWVDADNRHDFV